MLSRFYVSCYKHFRNLTYTIKLQTNYNLFNSSHVKFDLNKYFCTIGFVKFQRSTNTGSGYTADVNVAFLLQLSINNARCGHIGWIRPWNKYFIIPFREIQGNFDKSFWTDGRTIRVERLLTLLSTSPTLSCR